MVTLTQGDLFAADVEALVNPVNTMGLAGKGLALQFREVFPENFKAYQAQCAGYALTPGKVFVFRTEALLNPRLILNFPTKRSWWAPSYLKDIASGLKALIAVVKEEQIASLAIPALGCGAGGLDWEQVRPRIEAAFAPLPHVNVFLYPPRPT